MSAKSKRKAVERMDERLQERGDVACGWAFDLGMSEGARIEAEARVRLDWWLERGGLLAEVSDEALSDEMRRRGHLISSDAYALLRHSMESSVMHGRQGIGWTGVQTGDRFDGFSRVEFSVPAVSRDESDDE